MPNILKKPSDTKLDTDCLKRHKACDSEENYSFTDIRVLTVKYHTVCVCVCVCLTFAVIVVFFCGIQDLL